MTHRVESEAQSGMDRAQVARGSRVVCGVSGGADSLALLGALIRLGYDCVAAHCNFCLRGDESLRDERHTLETCRRLGVVCLVKHFDVERRRTETGESVEMACRELRYAWFEELRRMHGAEAIAVAHHRDDNAETMLLNLMRGTGLRGLRGMKWRNGHVVRPLLGCSRHDIEDYLREREITYITDSSNLQNEYRRNRIRNLILPAMREAFPDADRAITDTMEMLGEWEELCAEALSMKAERYMDGDTVDLAALSQREAQPGFILWNLLKDRGVSRRRAEEMVRAAGRSGRRFVLPDVTLVTDHGMLRPMKAGEGAEPDLDDCFVMETMEASALDPTLLRGTGCDTVFFDDSVLETTLACRNWRPGDRMKPFGLKGSKKLSDMFADAKMGVDLKARLPLLTANEEILWVPGLRRSRLFPVTDKTRTVVKITCRTCLGRTTGTTGGSPSESISG